jgi:hypothetical protein
MSIVLGNSGTETYLSVWSVIALAAFVGALAGVGAALLTWRMLAI